MSKTRSITLSNELWEQIEKQAEEQMRSVNAQVAFILSQNIEDDKKVK